MKKTNLLLILFTMVVAFLLTACANQATVSAQDDTPVTETTGDIVAEGQLLPVRALTLSFQAAGRVEEINVQTGDEVTAGDVLARLGNADQAQAQVAAARLAVVEAQQALDALNRTGSANLAAAWTAYMEAQQARAQAEREWEDLNVEDIEERLDDAQAEVEDRKADLEEAQEEFDKYQDLEDDNPARETAEDELETAQKDYNEAIRDLEEIQRERDTVRAALDAALGAEAEAKYQYERSTEGVNADQLALAQARLENALAQAAAAEDALANYVLTAPFDGVVADVAIEPGDQVSPSVRAVSIADPSAWIVETSDITELEVVDLEVGQSATFVADALPDVTMEGEITEISQASVIQGGDVIYTVRIEARDVDPRVKWGMTVEVIFEPASDN